MTEGAVSAVEGIGRLSPVSSHRRRRILLIAGTFPPRKDVGAIRVERVASTLAGAGHEVIVMTPGSPAEYEGVESTSGITELVPVDVGERYTARMLEAMRRVGLAPSDSGPTAGVPAIENAPTRFTGVRPLRDFVVALASVPDHESHYIRPYIRASRRWQPGDIDLVYSTAPPFSIHVAAERISRRLGAPLVLEYRDPWNHPRSERIVRQFAVTSAHDDYLERRCLRGAQHVIAVSEGAAALLRKRPETPPVHVSLNGIPSDLLDSPRPLRSGALSILYAGALYQARDPRPFLRAFANAIRALGWTPAEVRVDFVGECRRFRGQSVVDWVKELGLQHYVHFTDRVPHDEAIRRIGEADVLLLLVQGQPTQIPNKLYDYLATRVPIVAYADTHGEAARMLDAAGGHLVLDEQDEEQQSTSLRELLNTRLSDRGTEVGDPFVLDCWRSDRQMRLLLEALEL